MTDGRPRRTSDLRRAAPWLVSAAAHALLLVALLLLVRSADPPPEPLPPVEVRFESLAPSPVEQTDRAAPEPEDAPRADALPEPPRAAPPIDEEWLALRRRLLAEDAEAEQPDTPEPTPARADPAPTRADLLRLPPVPPGARSVEIAGLGASNVRDVVFVVDASGSMLTAFPEAMATLREAIANLHPTQRFQVLLFQTTSERRFLAPPLLGGPDRLVLLDATRSAKQAVSKWVGSVTPKGASDPLGALEAALGVRPDAVFLLSAGLRGVDAADVDPRRLLQRLDELNPLVRTTDGGQRRRVVIKTISLLEPDPTGLLQAIGARHAGVDGHRVLSREELMRRSR